MELGLISFTGEIWLCRKYVIRITLFRDVEKALVVLNIPAKINRHSGMAGNRQTGIQETALAA